MKALKLLLSLALVALLFAQCQKDEMTNVATDEDLKSGHLSTEGTFTVSIENVLDVYDFFESGVFNTPDGATSAGALLPGNSYSVEFHASVGHKLSFATMYVKSNDLFYGPGDTGIDLFNGLFEGEKEEIIDITDMVYLWDAGTEVNQEPGTGPDQPLNGGPDTGADDPDNTVRMVNDMYDYGSVNENIKVTLWYDGIDDFRLTIENLSDSPTPLAPGVWVVHTADYPIYQEGTADKGHGLEALAEDGSAGGLGNYLDMHSGYSSPLAPGIFVVHNNNKPLFDSGKADFGEGLEALAEDGDPSVLATFLNEKGHQIGTFGATGPGGTTTFTIDAKAGDYLSFATMLVHSNDLFLSPDERGIRLFHGNTPKEGEITEYIGLWDAGTEVNEYPGAGIHQPARLNGGIDENGAVIPVDDKFIYPGVDQIVKITITRN